MREQLLSKLQKLINKTLAQDPQFVAQLARFEGKLICLNIARYTMYVRFVAQQVRLDDHVDEDQEADLIITGTPFSLLRMAITRSEYINPNEFGILIKGDAGLAQELQRLFARLDIDWEGKIAEYTGEVIAHRLGKVARGVGAWAKQGTASLQQDAADYLQHECKLLPTAYEVDSWLSAVDTLRDDTERLLARWQLIKGRNS